MDGLAINDFKDPKNGVGGLPASTKTIIPQKTSIINFEKIFDDNDKKQVIQKNGKNARKNGPDKPDESADKINSSQLKLIGEDDPNDTIAYIDPVQKQTTNGFGYQTPTRKGNADVK